VIRLCVKAVPLALLVFAIRARVVRSGLAGLVRRRGYGLGALESLNEPRDAGRRVFWQ
jgi:hypothetical protein